MEKKLKKKTTNQSRVRELLWRQPMDVVGSMVVYKGIYSRDTLYTQLRRCVHTDNWIWQWNSHFIQRDLWEGELLLDNSSTKLMRMSKRCALQWEERTSGDVCCRSGLRIQEYLPIPSSTIAKLQKPFNHNLPIALYYNHCVYRWH